MLVQVTHCLKMGSYECNCDMTVRDTIEYFIIFWLGTRNYESALLYGDKNQLIRIASTNGIVEDYWFMIGWQK